MYSFCIRYLAYLYFFYLQGGERISIFCGEYLLATETALVCDLINCLYLLYYLCLEALGKSWCVLYFIILSKKI